MGKRLQSLAGKILRRGISDLDSDRYVYLSLDQAEPNPGNPAEDNSLFFSDADGTRGFTKQPKVHGLSFDNGELQEAGQNRDYALILNTDPTQSGDDSVGYRQLGDLAFTNESEITLQVVTENDNRTDQGIQILDFGTNGGGAVTNTYGLEISTPNSMEVAGVAKFDGTVQLNGTVQGAGIPGKNRIELLVIDSALAGFEIGKREFNFSNFTAPTLQQVADASLATGADGSSPQDGASTGRGIRAGFFKFNQLPPDRSSNAFPDYTKALVIDGVADSIGYRNLTQLALFDSTTDQINVWKLEIQNPGVDTLPGSGTVPLITWDETTKELQILDVDVTNLDTTFETLHSVSGRQEDGFDTGETGNRVIFSNEVKLRGGVLTTPTTSQYALIAEEVNAGDDSAVIRRRQLEAIAFNDSLIDLDFVLQRGTPAGSATQRASFGGTFELPNRVNLSGSGTPPVLVLGPLADSVASFQLNQIAYTGQEQSTLQDVTGRGDSTNIPVTLNGVTITAESQIGLQIDSGALGSTNTVNRFLVYDTSSGEGVVTLRSLDNEVLNGEDDTLQTVTERGLNGYVTTTPIQALGVKADSAEFLLLRVTDSASLASARVTDLTQGRLVVVGAGGELSDDANLTFDGATLTVNTDLNVTGISELDSTTVVGNLSVTGGEAILETAKVSDLTVGRVVTVGGSGELQDDANLTFDGTTLTAGGFTTGGNADITGTLDVEGISTLDSTTITQSLNLSNLKGAESDVVLTIDGANEVGTRQIQSTAFTGETLTTVTQNTRPAGYDTTPTPLYLTGGISINAPVTDTQSEYNILVIESTGDSVEYLTVSAGILDGSSNTLDAVLANGDTSSRDINLTGSGALTVDGFTTLDSVQIRGDAVVLGDLRVEGATTVINSTELSVNDVNITLADSATQASDADGGGITLNLGTDGNATILYSSTTDQWTFNKGVNFDSVNVAVDLDVDGATTLDSVYVDGGLNLQNLQGAEDDTVLTIDGTGEVQARDIPAYIFTGPTLDNVVENGNSTNNPVLLQAGLRLENLENVTTTSNDNVRVVIVDATTDSVQYRTAGNLLDPVNLQYVTDHSAVTTNKITASRLALTNLAEQPDLYQVLAYSNDSVETTTLETTAHTPLSYFTLDQAASTGGDQLNRFIEVTKPIRLSGTAELDGGFSAQLTNPGTPAGSFDVIRLVDPGTTDSAFRVTLQSGATKPAEDYTWEFVLGNGDSTGVNDVYIRNQLFIERSSLPTAGYTTSLVVPVFKATKNVDVFDSVGIRTLGTAANLAQTDITFDFATGNQQSTIGGLAFAETNNNIKIGRLIAGIPEFTGATYAPDGDGKALFITPSASGGADSVGYRDLGSFAFKDATTLQEVTSFSDGGSVSGFGDSTDKILKMYGIEITNGNNIFVRSDIPAINSEWGLMYDSDTDQVGLRKFETSAFTIPTLQVVTEAGDSTNKPVRLGGGITLPLNTDRGTPLLSASDIEGNLGGDASFYQMLVIDTTTDSVKRGIIGNFTDTVSNETLGTVTARGASRSQDNRDSTSSAVEFKNADFRLSNLANTQQETLVSIDTTTGVLYTRSVESVAQTSTLDTVTQQGNKAQRGIGVDEYRLRLGQVAFDDTSTTFSGEYARVLGIVGDQSPGGRQFSELTVDRGTFDSDVSIGGALDVDGATTLDATTVDGTFVVNGITTLDSTTIDGTLLVRPSAIPQLGTTKILLTDSAGASSFNYAVNGAELIGSGALSLKGFDPDINMIMDSDNGGAADLLEMRYLVKGASGQRQVARTFYQKSTKNFNVVAQEAGATLQLGQGSTWDHLTVDSVGDVRVNNGDFRVVTGNALVEAGNAEIQSGYLSVNDGIGYNALLGVGVAGYRPSTTATVIPQTQIIGDASTSASVAITRNGDNTFPPYLFFGKNRGTDENTDRAIVQNGDELGKVVWTGVDGTAGEFYPSAELRIVADGVLGNEDIPSRFEFRNWVDQVDELSLEINESEVVASGSQNATTLTIESRTTTNVTANRLEFAAGTAVDADARVNYADIRAINRVRTAGSETADIEIRNTVAGTIGRRIHVDSAGFVDIENTGAMRLQSGVQLRDANNNNLVIYDSVGTVLWGNV